MVAEGVVDDISHEGLRVLLREEGVTFQRIKTWKSSKDPRYAAKKARIEHLYAIADREVTPEAGDPEVVFCVDLCRHRDYAEGRVVGAWCAGFRVPVTRHSHRLSRNARILSGGW